MTQVVALLVKAKILIIEETEQFDPKVPNQGRPHQSSCALHVTSIPRLQSKKIHINLNLPIKAETKAESTDI
jgi:cullin 1